MNPWSDVDDIAYSRDAMRVAPVNVGSDPQVLVPPPDRFVILIHYVIFDYSWYPRELLLGYLYISRNWNNLRGNSVSFKDSCVCRIFSSFFFPGVRSST